MNKLILGVSVTVLAAGLASCGKDDGAPKAAKAKAVAPSIALSTAPIDVVKAKPHGIVSDTFDPCVYDPAALVSHFGFPADTRASQRQKDRRCFYTFQRMEPESSAPFANFHTQMSLVFDNGVWKSIGDPVKYDADISLWLSKGDRMQELTGLGARTAMRPANVGYGQMLLGYPVGGHWSSTLKSGPVTGGPGGEPISPVYKVDFAKFHTLAANLNGRLSAPSTVIEP